MSNNYFDNNPRVKVRGGGNDYFGEPYKRPVQGSGRGNGSGNGRGSGRGNERGRSRARKAPVPMLIIIDVLAAALLLLVFYVTNYEMQPKTTPIASLPVPSAVVSSTPAVTTPEVTVSPGETVSQTPTPTIDPNDWRAKFADKFTDGAVEQTDTSYKNANFNISIQKVQKDDITYFVAEIYVAELKYFKTAFPKKADVMGDRELTDKVANEVGAILAINGDHCVDNPGPVVRNGKLYREKKSSLDVLVMNYDGSMQTLSSKEFDIEKVKAEGVYQVWAFGPTLLKNGQPTTDFNMPDAIGEANPRTAVGYYEPGHYCFVLVDGRQPGYSEGMNMDDLSKLMAELGCTAAYNMDGGRSAEMVFMGKLISHPMEGRRSTTDILYIGE